MYLVSIPYIYPNITCSLLVSIFVFPKASTILVRNSRKFRLKGILGEGGEGEGRGGEGGGRGRGEWRRGGEDLTSLIGF